MNKTPYYSTYKKLVVQCHADTFVVNGNLVYATIFVLKVTNILYQPNVNKNPQLKFQLK